MSRLEVLYRHDTDATTTTRLIFIVAVTMFTLVPTFYLFILLRSTDDAEVRRLRGSTLATIRQLGMDTGINQYTQLVLDVR